MAEVEYTENTVEEETAIVTAGANYLSTLVDTAAPVMEAYGFDATSDEGEVRLFNAESDADSLAESGLAEMALVGLAIKPGVRVDPVTGERNPCANTTFFTSDGDTYVSQSNGIARDAARLIALINRKGGWESGKVYTVRVIETKLSGGRTLKKLALV